MLMAQDQTGQELLSQLAEQFAQCDTTSSLGKLRKKAWKALEEQGLPTRKWESYGYVPLSKLYKKSCAPAEAETVKPQQVYPECSQSHLVLVNGRYAPELSNLTAYENEIVILPIDQAMRAYGTFLSARWQLTLKEEQDPFAKANLALGEDGVVIYVPPKKQVETPLQIIEVITSDEGLLHPQVHLMVGAESQLDLIRTTEVQAGSHFVSNGLIDIALEPAAQVRLSTQAWNVPDTAWHLSSLHGTLKRDSRLITVSTGCGAETIRENYSVYLKEENAEALLHGLWMLEGGRQHHTHVLVQHQAPHCHSTQLFKGALGGYARSSFEGKIYVEQKAQQTDAYQLNNNLLLSDDAHADSKPNLEIFADDVKASHGATVGQLNEDHLFYLQARGCSAQKAKQLLLMGYAEEVIEKIATESQRSAIEHAMHDAVDRVTQS